MVGHSSSYFTMAKETARKLDIPMAGVGCPNRLVKMEGIIFDQFSRNILVLEPTL